MQYSFSLQAWESKFLDNPFYKFVFYDDAESSIENYNFVDKTIVSKIITLSYGEYVTVVVNSTNYGAFKALDDLGFHLLVPMVDMSKRLYLSIASYRKFEIRSFKDSDLDAVLRIAGNSFKYSRYHAEPDFNIELANAMHIDWTKNCCNKSLADETLVYEILDDVVGYISLKKDGDKSKIVLIAVDNKYKGMGVGTYLVKAACDWSTFKGCNEIEVRTELPNIAAVHIYSKNGFSIDNSFMYFGRTV